MTVLKNWAGWMTGLLLALGSPAHASSALAFDLPQMSKRAELIVRGTVLTVSSRWLKGGSRIATTVELEVHEVLKGHGPKRLFLMQPGGQVNDIVQRVSGMPSYRPGAEVVLFLERGPRSFLPVGLSQGVFRVERGQSREGPRAIPIVDSSLTLLDSSSLARVAPRMQPMALDALRAQVSAAHSHAATGREAP